MQCASPLYFLVHKEGAVLVLPHPDGLGLAVGRGLARHDELVVPLRTRPLRLARERQAAGRKPQLLLQRGEARPQVRLVLARRPVQDHLGGAEQERLSLCVRESRGVNRVGFKRQRHFTWVQKATTCRIVFP